MGHVRARLMALYARDAIYHEKPWELWEHRKQGGNNWYPLLDSPIWRSDMEYRRKIEHKKTLHGCVIPMPEKYPLDINTTYFVPKIRSLGETQANANVFIWTNDINDYWFLSTGLVHTSRENAITHAESLLKTITFLSTAHER